MWYKAARYTEGSIARDTFDTLKRIVLARPVNITPLSLIYEAYWYALVIAEEAPDTETIRLLEAALRKDGRLTELPESVITSLLHRRRERMRYAQPTRSGLTYENHEPTPVAYSLSSNEPLPTKEENRNHLQAIVADLLHMGYPYKEVYRSYFKYRLQQDRNHLGIVPESAEGLISAHMYTLSTAKNYMLTESARSMHAYVSTNNPQWIEPQKSVWIEHDLPQIAKDVPGEKVRAVYAFTLSDEKTIQALPVNYPTKFLLSLALMRYQHMWFINVINDITEVIVSYIYEPDRGYMINFDHTCPYDMCERLRAKEALQRFSLERLAAMRIPSYASMEEMSDTSVVIPCKHCLLSIEYWSRWLHTTMRMINGDYATSPEPVSFPIKDHTYTEKTRVPRKHGKGAPKEKTLTYTIPYTYITYDVSVQHDLQEEHTTEENAHTRSNWFTIYPKEARIYERRQIPDIHREYKGHRYRSLIQRVLQGDTVSQEGEHYQLVPHPDGSYSVIGTVKYPNGKYIPLLRPDIKGEKIVKLTATAYEHQHSLPSPSQHDIL